MFVVCSLFFFPFLRFQKFPELCKKKSSTLNGQNFCRTSRKFVKIKTFRKQKRNKSVDFLKRFISRRGKKYKVNKLCTELYVIIYRRKKYTNKERNETKNFLLQKEIKKIAGKAEKRSFSIYIKEKELRKNENSRPGECIVTKISLSRINQKKSEILHKINLLFENFFLHIRTAGRLNRFEFFPNRPKNHHKYLPENFFCRT